MVRHTHIALAATLTLVAQGAAAFSPYYPQPLPRQFVQAYPYALPPGATGAYVPIRYRPPYPGYQPLAPNRTVPAKRPRSAQGDARKSELVPEPKVSTRVAAEVAAPTTATPATPVAASSPPMREHQAEFFERLQPLIAKENERLLDLRDELSDLLDAIETGHTLTKAQRRRLATLARTYRVTDDPLTDAAARRELLDKVDVIPVSLALAQAANESAWGKSRFAQEANNLFGIWTYDEGLGIVPHERAAGKKHLVRKFDSIAESVRYYMLTLNSHPAYGELRAIRAQLRDNGEPLDGHSMADGLTRYSAKGDEYVRLIQSMIRRFDLASFDATGNGKA